MRTDYYSIKNMPTPSREMYGIGDKETVLLVGTAKPQPWAVTIDIDPFSPANIVADGVFLPFKDKQFDAVILDYVVNFLPKARAVDALIKEANRVGHRVVGRCSISMGKRITLRGAKPRYTLPAYPQGVRWIKNSGVT
jgi:hypothetical protein